MKISRYILVPVAAFCLGLSLSSCKDFSSINTNPNAANKEQINPIWLFNKSMTEAQMNPEIGERVFTLYWMDASRYATTDILTRGNYSEEWDRLYFNNYISSWISNASAAISIADQKIKENKMSERDKKMTALIRDASKIWRIYLLSEFADNFGPTPTNAGETTPLKYNSLKETYGYCLSQLKEIVDHMDTSVVPTDDEKIYDRAYGFDGMKWKRFANSLRMRLAMRISNVEPDLARQAFEDAVKGDYIKEESDMFKVKENNNGWNALNGVFSRSWDDIIISETLVNLSTGLGGIPSEKVYAQDQTLDNPTKDAILAKIKPANYLGLYFPKNYPTYSNDPYNGFFCDGVPHSVDPRILKNFVLAGEKTHINTPSTNVLQEKKDTVRMMEDTVILATIKDPYYTFNGVSVGAWGDKGTHNKVYQLRFYLLPALAKSYRDGSGYRVFFAAWESDFLIAEAALKGWSTPMSAKEAYEKGIRDSFAYQGLSDFTDDYLASTDYNRVGTSVAWDHTAEPPHTVKMDYIDGYTNEHKTFDYTYPDASKTLYGKALNDHMVKIMTQKYIAQCPYGALEAWSDFRRTGLPFFETPVAESSIPTMTNLSKKDAIGQQKAEYFPQRLKYPVVFQNADPKGYKQAVDLLGGQNEILTPLWWSKH